MSMTKRHIESLPEEEQDAICGDRAQEEEWFARVGEWTEDAENEPDDPTDEELWQWACALMEEAEEADKFTERDEAPLQKPVGKCVSLADNNGVEWKL